MSIIGRHTHWVGLDEYNYQNKVLFLNYQNKVLCSELKWKDTP